MTKKGGKGTKKREGSKKWMRYDLEGKIKRKNKFCPKCGPGVFMAHHADRDSCGKCNYTEFRKHRK